MSEILHGVLNMPPELWCNDEVSILQRYSCYLDASRSIEELEQRIADAESELDELYKELFIFAHDVMCFENDKMPDWVFEKAKAIYGRLCLGKGE